MSAFETIRGFSSIYVCIFIPQDSLLSIAIKCWMVENISWKNYDTMRSIHIYESTLLLRGSQHMKFTLKRNYFFFKWNFFYHLPRSRSIVKNPSGNIQKKLRFAPHLTSWLIVICAPLMPGSCSGCKSILPRHKHEAN